MSGKRLLIIRKPDSPLLDYLDSEAGEIVLIQNGVFSSVLSKKGAKILENDAKAAGIENLENSISYDGLLDAILEANQIVVV